MAMTPILLRVMGAKLGRSPGSTSDGMLLLLMAFFKDLFSAQSSDYARYRPRYPEALFDWLAGQTARKGLAVDLGCGSGQASVALAGRFEFVIGVDPSQAQLDNAAKHERLAYVCAPAEKTGLAGGGADLVTVAQAFHWFKRPEVYGEMKRLSHPGAVLAIWCYELTKVSPRVDAAIWKLYYDHLDTYWEPERKLVEEGYKNVDLPFKELSVPKFPMREEWTLEQFRGYISTWSPLKRFRMEKGFDPLEKVWPEVRQAWGDQEKQEIFWPLRVRAFEI